MSDLDHQIVHLRRKLRILKMAQRGAANDMAWRMIRACLNAYFMEYIEVVELRAAPPVACVLDWGCPDLTQIETPTPIRGRSRVSAVGGVAPI